MQDLTPEKLPSIPRKDHLSNFQLFRGKVAVKLQGPGDSK